MTPRKLLEALAPYEPINQDECGGCVFCAGTPPGRKWDGAGRFLSDHEVGCPWIKARRLLGDEIPAARGPSQCTKPRVRPAPVERPQVNP